MENELHKKAVEIAERLAKEVSGIDLILLYGGLAQGREHMLSDFDMIAICDSKKITWEFIWEENPVKLWSLTWEEAEDIIKGYSGIWCVAAASLLEVKVVWFKSKKMSEKFSNLQFQAKDSGLIALKRYLHGFDALYGKLWRMQEFLKEKNHLDFSFLKWDVLNNLVCILSSLNNQYLKTNWGKNLQEVSSFENIPDDFYSRCEKFLLAEDEEALQIGSKLVDDVNIIIKNWLNSQEGNNEENIQSLTSEFPSFIEYLNKSKLAAQKDDLISGLYAANDNAELYLLANLTFQNEKWERNSFYTISESIINLSKNTPKNISILLESKNLVELMEATEQLAAEYKEEIILRGATLPIAQSLDGALQFLQFKERKSP